MATEGSEVGTAYVSIVPSGAGFGAQLETLVTGEAGRAGTKAGKALSDGVRTSTAGIVGEVGGLFAAIGTARFLRGAIAEAEEVVRVGNLTNAVIRSTGGAAGVTADQVERLAGSLGRVAGIDAEVVQSAENVLLTFTQVRNQAGQGNDVFNQAARAAVDLSAALGTDLQGAVVQLGKALQDPTQGLLALRRSGVSFTEAQQDQIRTLVETGNLLEAQKIILSEVRREFGGAAAAGATATARLGVAVQDLQESLGTVLLPAVEVTADAMTALVGGFVEAPGPIRTVGSAMLLAAGGIAAAGLAIGLLAPKIRAARLELEALGLAGTKASAAIGVIGKAGTLLLGSVLAVQLADTVSGVKDLDKQVGALAKTTDEQLNKAFHDTNNELRGWDLWQSLGISKRHDEFETFNKVLEAGNFALAQRIIVSETDIDVRNRLQGAYDKAVVSTQQFNKDQTLSAQIIGGTGQAIDETAPKVKSFAERWDELRGELDDIIASDWSQQLASNLTSALNPLERFVVGSGKNIEELRNQVSSAKADLDAATADLAKFEGTATSAEIARIRGQAGEIIEARNRVNEASRRFRDASDELAEAQKSPLQTIRENLKANLDTITRWLANLDTIRSRLGGTAGVELAKHLGSLGPQAADAIAEAARLKPADLAKIEGLFDQTDQAIGDAASGAFELNLDQAGRPGETLAEIIADRYEKSLAPKIGAATLAALEEATTLILSSPLAAAISGAHAGREEREQARLGAPTKAPTLGPAGPAPLPLPAGYPFVQQAPPPVTTIGGITFGDINITTPSSEPHDIAAETGDYLAWRLTGAAQRGL